VECKTIFIPTVNVLTRFDFGEKKEAHITSCRLVNVTDAEKISGPIFSINQPQGIVNRLGLLHREDGCTTPLRNVGNYQSTRCDIPPQDPRQCVRSLFSCSEGPRSRLDESRDQTEFINTAAVPEQDLFSTVASDAVTELGRRFRMPETSSPYINGFQQNGHMDSELVEDTFLFTSESVGEGHPGE
jgi:hypothetical protein